MLDGVECFSIRDIVDGGDEVEWAIPAGIVEEARRLISEALEEMKQYDFSQTISSVVGPT